MTQTLTRPPVFTDSFIEDLLSQMLAWAKQPKFKYTMKDVVAKLRPALDQALYMGYDWEDMAEFLTTRKFPISPSTLRRYYFETAELVESKEGEGPEFTGPMPTLTAPRTRKPRAKKPESAPELSINNDGAVETVAQVENSVAEPVTEAPTEPAIAEAVVESQVAPEESSEVQAPVAEVSESATEAPVTETQAETAIAEVPTSESAAEAPVTETQAETEESASELDVEVQSPEVESTTESPTASEPSGGTSEDDWNEEELDEEEQRRKLMAEACGLDYVPRHKRRPQVEIGNFRK